MADMTTIARPYAKAIFEHALAAEELAEWSKILNALAQATLNPHASQFIDSPATTADQQSQLLLSVINPVSNANEKQAIENFIVMLAGNKRLPLLPDISAQYEVLRAEQEKTLTVDVSSFTELTEKQQQNLIKSLTQRLQRQITLDVTVDKSLLGGAVIRAGDLVIDGSVRGKLNKLGTDLAV